MSLSREGLPIGIQLSAAHGDERTLLELASRQPTSRAQLAEVGGIGAAKLERYGEALLEVLAGAA